MLVALVVVVAGLSGGSDALASKSAARPFFLSVVASPGRTAAEGEMVVVSVRVRNALSCTFFSQRAPLSSLYLVKTMSCASGRASATMPAVANPAENRLSLHYVVVVHGRRGSVRRSLFVIEDGTPAAPPPPTSPPPTPPAAGSPTANLAISPSAVVPSTGGSVVLSYAAANASLCWLSSAPAFWTGNNPQSVSCSGTYPATVPSSTTGRTWTFTFTATSASGQSVSATQTLTEQAPPPPPAPAPSRPPPPSVVGLDVCTAGPDCFYGPIYSTYPTYGNVAPDNVGDCTFAAAANWEQIVHHATPNPAVIVQEFAAAGGTAAGLSVPAFFGYWEQQGIAGIVATGFHGYLTDQTNVRNGVRDFGAMLVEMRFVTGDGVGTIPVPAGLHMAVVDGFTPEGPLVVTWGRTVQMTWEQWNAEVIGMWGVATS